MKTIPKFKDQNEEIAFWETNDAPIILIQKALK